MGSSQRILQHIGIPQLPGICWYPAKHTGHTVNQGGTTDKAFYSSLTESIFLSRAFLSYKAPLTRDINPRSFSCFGEINKMMTKRWWRSERRTLETKQKVSGTPKPT